MLEFVPAHPVEAAKECAGIRELDNAVVCLIEPLCDGSGTTVAFDTGAADSHTSLIGIIRLVHPIERVDDRETSSTTHGVEFRIDRAQGIPRNGLRCSPTLLAKSASINSRISLMTSILSGWMLNSVWRV